jgi:hypothetical protein
MAQAATGLPRLGFCICRCNYALDGAGSMSSENLTTQLSHSDMCRASELKWRGAPPGIPPELADALIARLREGKHGT